MEFKEWDKKVMKMVNGNKISWHDFWSGLLKGTLQGMLLVSFLIIVFFLISLVR